MRPEILFPLFSPIKSLPGIGPRNAQHIEKIAGPYVIDLLWHLPREIIDRRYKPRVVDAENGRIATLDLLVKSHQPPPRKGLPYRVLCSDKSGTITLAFFHGHKKYLNDVLPVGEIRIVSGRVERYRGEVQMLHPDHILMPNDGHEIKEVEAVYPMTEGLSPKTLSKAIDAACNIIPDMPEWLDQAYLAKQNWPSWRECLLHVHTPTSETDLDLRQPARARLAYDELLANQLALALVRDRLKERAGRSLKGNGNLRRRLLSKLPYELTKFQKQTIKEINLDMASPNRMLRLLQGDVGSGKTIVALFAMLNAVECGKQAALMVPTEILAKQHFDTIRSLTPSLSVAILTGRATSTKRKQILQDLESGLINIVVGTHALFQESIALQDLGLAVIDEQHRFGVYQRLSLQSKGRTGDILVMTATPIPRSLMLTSYGDLDVSLLKEKPINRRTIDTRVVSLKKINQIKTAVARRIKAGSKVFWVCPLIEESEKSDLAAAENRYIDLRSQHGNSVELIHGRMKDSEKNAAMDRFNFGSANILVATTVIEVGVDISDATMIVIEHAERFGLAQLHQLRGRVGRSDQPSTCLLLYASPLGENAKARLSVLRTTDDGFRIAEEDLRLRGPGELLGAKQSGLPEFRVANVITHADLLVTARKEAQLVINTDPTLQSTRGSALRNLLYLHEREAAIKNLQSG